MNYRGELYKRKSKLLDDFKDFKQTNGLKYDLKINIRGIHAKNGKSNVTFSIDYFFSDGVSHQGLVYQNIVDSNNYTQLLVDLDNIIFYCKDQIFKGEYDMQWSFGDVYESLKTKLKKDIKNIEKRLDFLP